MLLAGASVLTGAAQSKFDAAGTMVMSAYAEHLKNPAAELPLLDITGVKAALSGRADDRVPVFVALHKGYSASDVEVRGFDILSDLGDILIVSGTMSDIQSLSECDFVKSMSFGQQRKPLLDKAREDTGVDKIHAGEGLSQAYTGAGIITGLMDTGLDANHANFLDSEGKTRIARVWRFSFPGRYTEYTSDNLGSYKIDVAAQTHGTHTLGCMAGSFNLPGGKIAVQSGHPLRPTVTLHDDVNNPYYGAATKSIIVAGCGTLDDANTIISAENTLTYAKEQQKPAVFNLSLGSVLGPHDGSTLLNQTLGRLGEDMIICISAGNDGDVDMSIDETFSNEKNSFSTLFVPTVSSNSGVSGFIDFWSDTATPFEITAFIYDTYSKKILSEVISLDGSSETTIKASTDNADFANAFSSGELRMTSNKNAGTNGRYNVLVYTYLSFNKSTNRNRNLMLGFKVTGTPGQRIMVATNSDNSIFSDNGETGLTKGSSINSINDMACGRNIICVGSYNTRNLWPTIGGMVTYKGVSGMNTNEISGFSSYATLIDGRTLPDVCAPGCAIISSISNEHVKLGYTPESSCTAIQDYNGRTNHWLYMQGTSMSSPFCAGVIALWLEANPTLGVEDVRTIIKETATKDEKVTGHDIPEQWGAGKLNAYEGIKMAINMSGGVNDITIEGKDKMIMTSTGTNAWEIYMPHASSINAEMYNLAGTRVASANADGDTLNFSAEGISAGIYVISVNGTEARRVIVR